MTDGLEKFPMSPSGLTPCESGRRLPLVLLPGFGTDAALFRLQQSEFPDLIVPQWITPLRNERLENYARRLAERIEVRGPCLVGGASFGGIVAQELARHLPAVGCILIASIRSPRQLPKRFRIWTPFARVIPGISAAVSGWLARGVRRSARWPTSVDSGLAAYAGPQGGFERWGAIAVLRWRPQPPPCPVFQIHGAVDRVFPVRRTTPDVVLPGAGHLLTLTHAFAVNTFLTEVRERILSAVRGDGRHPETAAHVQKSCPGNAADD